jgi:N-acetylneuraminic acid mutarotase
MYVLGGLGESGHPSANVHKLDSTQGTWSEVAPMPHTRFGHGVCALGSDIHVFGGCDNREQEQDSVFKYDAAQDAWTTLAPIPSPCAFHGATVSDGQIYLTGVGNSGEEFLLFDPVTSMWSTLTSTVHRRNQGSLFVLGGCLHVAGGNENSTSVERYEVANDAWTAVADMLECRRLFGAVTILAAGPAEEQNLNDALIVKATQ